MLSIPFVAGGTGILRFGSSLTPSIRHCVAINLAMFAPLMLAHSTPEASSSMAPVYQRFSSRRVLLYRDRGGRSGWAAGACCASVG